MASRLGEARAAWHARGEMNSNLISIQLSNDDDDKLSYGTEKGIVEVPRYIAVKNAGPPSVESLFNYRMRSFFAGRRAARQNLFGAL